jgi:hypothetical protein
MAYFGFQIDPGAYIIIQLPYYDIGFLPTENVVTCDVDGTPTPCRSYRKVDWIVMKTLPT